MSEWEWWILNWTRQILCVAYSIGFFKPLQQILSMNTNMKAFISRLKIKLDTDKSKYKRFKDKIPGMWPKPWKCLCNWFPLGIFGVDAKCVCLNFSLVSFCEYYSISCYIKSFRIFLKMEEILAISLMRNWWYGDPETTNNILQSLLIEFPFLMMPL